MTRYLLLLAAACSADPATEPRSRDFGAVCTVPQDCDAVAGQEPLCKPDALGDKRCTFACTDQAAKSACSALVGTCSDPNGYAVTHCWKDP